MTQRYCTYIDGMVTALLQGRKRQARYIAAIDTTPTGWSLVQPGERILVKEWWCPDGYGQPMYRADSPNLRPYHDDWHCPESMPVSAARMQLHLTDKKFEQLNDITIKDALLEGVEAIGTMDGPRYRNYKSGGLFPCPRDAFASLWCSMHGPVSLHANPAVVVLHFDVEQLTPYVQRQVV